MSTTEDEYWELLEGLPDPHVVVDEEGTVIFANSGFDEYVGPKDAIGSPFPSLLYSEDRDDVWEVLDTVAADPGSVTEFEFRTQRSDGDWRVLEAIGRHLTDTGPVTGTVVAMRDITDRKQRERELEKENDRLDEFASIVSHDLRNPLQVAKLHLESIDGHDSGTTIGKIRRSHDRMEEIIDNVLALARHGEGVAETDDVSLRAVSEAAWETVDTKEMELVFGEDLTLRADPPRLQQLLENLFRNAAEHAGPTATVTVGKRDLMVTSTRAQPPAGFFVADDGPGLPVDEGETVFDSGFSTESSGTGFGLAIVKQIAEAHDWRVTVGDSLDGGARFEFMEIPESERLKPEQR